MTNRFVNREKELEYLTRVYKEQTSSLIVLYGRRRIGKTTLIKEFIKDKTALYLIATEESEKENKKNFQWALSDLTQNSLLKKAVDLEWDDIFLQFKSYQPKGKKILVIDEFQYLGRANKGFPSVFQKIWDEILVNDDVMVILCGSLVSMMIKQTLSYSSPLYGRRTGQIRLKQIGYKDYGTFFEKTDKINLIEYYSVTGGVPKYIELFNPMDNIFQAIENYILLRQSFLYEEPVFLLEKEVGSIGTYFSIIKSIAAGNHKIGRIASDLGIKQSGATRYLKTLIELDILERIVPVTEKNPEKSKMGLYLIRDNFIKFWFRFVYPYRNYLELENTGYVLEILKQNFYDNHVSYVFEDICREKVMDLDIQRQLGISLSKVGKWWDKNSEIDIVGISEGFKDIFFGECKYTRAKVDAGVYFNLKEKAQKVNYPPGVEKHFAVFSKSGFTQRMKDLKEQDSQLYLFQVL